MDIACVIGYNGKQFNGFQVQKNKRTVQQELQTVLFDIFKTEITVIASGRTDTGVSAIGQVINFHVTEDNVDVWRLQNRMNAMLPSDVQVLKCYPVSETFHARYDAKQKTYAYNFYLSPFAIPYYDQFATRFSQNVNEEVFLKNAQMCIGTHDFTSFCASNTQVTNKVRTVSDVQLIKNGNLFTLLITGNGFLYNMVRIMVGTLVDVSSGKLNKTVLQVLESKDRTQAGFTASSTGLVLVKVEYV